jgi:anti-sigma B factor antagonist
MKKSNIMIARSKRGYEITIKGRATFDCSSPLRNFAENIVPGSIEKIFIDLTNCVWLDSTFMGTLAMLGLNAQKANIDVEIINIDDKNFKLLKELGVNKLFKYNNRKCNNPDAEKWENIIECINNEPSSEEQVADTILEAHKTLMEVDDDNINKFQKVVEMVEKEIIERKKKK